ncbi:hypothetical protein KSF73_14665 [Burkholderiaceae bacterium DAT-1]|nr:hypothetical protein [Burkholderiaceae bacterium DAT-1]
MKYTILAVLVATGLSGCSTITNTSLLDGKNEFGRVDFKLHPVRVVAIDGDYTVDRDPVRAEPGVRTLRLQTAPVAGFHTPPSKDVQLSIEPCTRYYLAARRENPLTQDFQLVVHDKEPVAGCVVRQGT